MKAKILLSLCVCAFAPFARAGQASLYVKRFEQKYRGTKTLQATFLEQYSENGRLVRSEAGTAYFLRPGKMRWEYVSPEKNLFLVDGKTAWFYTPADHTVTRVPAKKSEDWRTPLALLAGEVKMSHICGRVEIDPSLHPADPDVVVLRCELRGAHKPAREDKSQPGAAEQALTPESGPELVQFELECNSGELRRGIIHDPGGVELDFAFANWIFDPPLEEKSFHFEPPKGVAIVNGEVGASGGGAGQW